MKNNKKPLCCKYCADNYCCRGLCMSIVTETKNTKKKRNNKK